MGGFAAAFLLLLVIGTSLAPARAETPLRLFVETPSLVAQVRAGKMPPVAERLPDDPELADMTGKRIGRPGGDLHTLMGSSSDTKRMVVYGYARLVVYDRDFDIVPDLLKSYEVKEGRIFTLHLRKGHKWSDGYPFTAEDFRYYWEDFATDPRVSKSGPPVILRVDGELPRFEVLDETTVRYSWSKPNPYFLPALAGAAPLYLYRPAHYMKRFHLTYTDPETLHERVEEHRQRNWVALQYNMGRQYRNNNPDLPSLQPWVLKTRPPSDRYIFERNPFYHRIDPNGRQLPYIDRWIVGMAAPALIPAKAGTGDTDLQAYGLPFSNITFLKEGERRNGYTVHLWRTASGSEMALYPNLNTIDPVWRPLVRNADFRRALSLGINRSDINQTVYFGMAVEGNNTVLPESPLYRRDYTTRWATYDPEQANKLLDGLGLAHRNEEGLRLLANGEPMELVVETASNDLEQSDVLYLLGESWRKLGIKLHVRVLERETFRNRIFSGSTVMCIWSGMDNGVPSADFPPNDLAPTSQIQYQWPKWGQYVETRGRAGTPIDLEPAKRLAELDQDWMAATDRDEKTRIWQEMLEINADQVFTIGTVAGVPQPVVVSDRLHNVPEKGLFNWDPGAHFGIYRPDTFWLEKAAPGN